MRTLLALSLGIGVGLFAGKLALPYGPGLAAVACGLASGFMTAAVLRA